MDEIKLVVIVGPTSVGKTALSIDLAKRFDGEVISADSRQIYCYMDIGTAKATPEQRAAVPHHLIDVVDPDQKLTLAHYKRLASHAIHDIWERGGLPMLVGGTGLYVRALLEGWTIPEVPPNRELRRRLKERVERVGAEVLHERLQEVDPGAAESIDANNVRRVIRALEVYEETGTPISELQKKKLPNYDTFKIGLTMPRPDLYERIDARVDRMIEEGLVEEVEYLLERGYDLDLPSMSAVGYPEIGRYLRDEATLDEAVSAIKTRTHRIVRQQYNWFKLSDPTIHWFDAREVPTETIAEKVRDWLTRENEPVQLDHTRDCLDRG
ncbi:MAG: tRNA (adenosine(37)-N6)-dimethylallyltransferase MiaA [Chloroflexota bacterium]|nr:tRNA (adenosine(37)-N6)-dimethylallyltransferase MiaA [Chloroflexota bacterium]